ncbi:VOC family protein [Microvirga brassicacearum]|uniref:VOC family protein n=2 Tax=Microvirga brassicacearum TaxID=2580413 RepID=A0A5N3P5B5_9HYPH|nr:VOC family protein [Microvirga brassicacearum]
MKAACDDELLLTLTIFVEHGRQQEAAIFYETAVGAVRTKTHLLPSAVQTETIHIREGEVMALDLRVGDRVIAICGSNPRREAEPSRGGPFFLKEKGAGATVFRLEVNDAEAVLKRAVTAGAAIRDALQVANDGHRCASFFDPFGHIWALHERVAVAKREAA